MIYFPKADASSLEKLLRSGFSDRGECFTKTFIDPEFKYHQCNNWARRSFSDLLEICQTYIPTVTREQLAHYLLKESKNHYINYCKDIEKIVVMSLRLSMAYDSYMPVDRKGIDDISMKDILDWANNYKK